MFANASPCLRSRALYPILGLVLAATFVPASGVAGAAGSKSVTLKDVVFAPKSISVAKGTRVTFAFQDEDTAHNVTSMGRRRFKAIGDRTSGSPSRTFTRSGTYRYECTLHPGMTGRITVR